MVGLSLLLFPELAGQSCLMVVSLLLLIRMVTRSMVGNAW